MGACIRVQPVSLKFLSSWSFRDLSQHVAFSSDEFRATPALALFSAEPQTGRGLSQLGASLCSTRARDLSPLFPLFNRKRFSSSWGSRFKRSRLSISNEDREREKKIGDDVSFRFPSRRRGQLRLFFSFSVLYLAFTLLRKF